MTVPDRIQSYLENGGFFNPEAMEHDKVRDLIMACRDEIAYLDRDIDRLRAPMTGTVQIEIELRNNRLALLRAALWPKRTVQLVFPAASINVGQEKSLAPQSCVSGSDTSDTGRFEKSRLV